MLIRKKLAATRFGRPSMTCCDFVLAYHTMSVSRAVPPELHVVIPDPIKSFSQGVQ